MADNIVQCTKWLGLLGTKWSSHPSSDLQWMSEIFANHDFLLRGELCWAKIKVIKEQQIYVSFSYCHLKALCCTFVFFCDDETECLFVFVKMSIIALSILQIEHQVLFAVVRTLLEQMSRNIPKNDIAYLVCWVDWQYMFGWDWTCCKCRRENKKEWKRLVGFPTKRY